MRQQTGKVTAQLKLKTLNDNPYVLSYVPSRSLYVPLHPLYVSSRSLYVPLRTLTFPLHPLASPEPPSRCAIQAFCTP